MRGRTIILGSTVLLIILVTLATPYLAQAPPTSVSVGACYGPITIYPSDSLGNFKSTFTTGETVYLTLIDEQGCAQPVTVTVTVKDPTGTLTTLINNQYPLPAGVKTTLALFKVSTANPSGQWIIYVTIDGVNAAPIAININSQSLPLPLWLLATIIIVVVAAVLGVLAVMRIMGGKGIGGRGRAKEEQTRVLPAPIQQAPITAPERERTKVGVVLYRLRLPNGMEIPVSEPYRVFGRETFERYGLPKDALDFITREDRGGHFKIYLRGTKWFIEDLGSTNGTLLNGVEIKGKGPQELKNGDTISPAGVMNIVFRIEQVG
jgi:hypothetical protein